MEGSLDVLGRRTLGGASTGGRAGYSILELIVALAILMLVSGFAVVRFRDARSQSVVRSAVSELVQLHSLAQAAAVRWGTVSELHLRASPPAMWVEIDTGGVQTDTVDQVMDVDPALSMATDRTLLCFDARGIATSAGSCQDGAVRVVFSHGDRSDTLTTTSLGLRLR